MFLKINVYKYYIDINQLTRNILTTFNYLNSCSTRQESKCNHNYAYSCS